MAVTPGNTLICNIKDGMNDWSRNIIGGILTAAAIAAAAHNADMAFRIAQREWNLAKKYWRISDHWLNYYKDVYAPAEDKELEEAKKLTSEKPLYATARGRAKATAWLQFKGLAHKAMCRTSKYHTGQRQYALSQLAISQANALSMCDALGYRNERAYIETRDQVRFSRQLETVKRGRNMVANAHTFGEASAGIYGKLADQYWEGLVGAGQFVGYMFNRSEPDYPFVTFKPMERPKPTPEQIGEAGEQLLRQII